jgi:hypothetical protein
LVAGREPRIGRHAPAIAPDLAAAQDAVDVAFRNTLEHAHQEIVDTLPMRVVADHKPVHSILA